MEDIYNSSSFGPKTNYQPNGQSIALRIESITNGLNGDNAHKQEATAGHKNEALSNGTTTVNFPNSESNNHYDFKHDLNQSHPLKPETNLAYPPKFESTVGYDVKSNGPSAHTSGHDFVPVSNSSHSLEPVTTNSVNQVTHEITQDSTTNLNMSTTANTISLTLQNPTPQSTIHNLTTGKLVY